MLKCVWRQIKKNYSKNYRIIDDVDFVDVDFADENESNKCWEEYQKIMTKEELK
jgi:hypothetical protein